jgi:transcriptional regulator with XRE-family HTH domain
MITPEKIKEIRLSKNLSQEDFALKLGVSNEYISRIENGKNPVTHKLQDKLFKLGFLSDQEKTPEAILNTWGQALDLTESEKKLLASALVKDKEVCFYLFKALNGDVSALEKLKKLIC